MLKAYDNGNLLRIDRQIINIDKVIYRHIGNIGVSCRGVISQDILAQLRNLIEHIMLKFYSQGKDIENSYENISSAIKYVRSRGNLKVLIRFHEYLQIVASHYTLDEENSERLMLKYYEYLVKTKNLFEKNYDYTILDNLEMFPLSIDRNMQEYYEKIAVLLSQDSNKGASSSDKYYIQKIKPFFVNQKVYYEVTFTPANDHASKFNRVIAFTSLEIQDNYAVRLSVAEKSINILGKTMPILVVVGWEVSIRNCEYKNFSSLIRGHMATTGHKEQDGLSRYLTNTGFNLAELVRFSQADFNQVRAMVTKDVRKVVFFDDLEECRDIINNNRSGSNILLYLLSNMNNKIIKNQRNFRSNVRLSNLYLDNGTIPFDKMPFNSSPRGHNPKLSSLFRTIKSDDRQHELLARLVRNNSEIKGNLFTPVTEIGLEENIDELIDAYNSRLWTGHVNGSKLVKESGHVFINGYREDTVFIIDELRRLSAQGIKNFQSSMDKWLAEPYNGVDCEEKKTAMSTMFENSMVSLVYGSAGTGKSTLINHISHFFSNESKLYLAQTNPAVDNLKRRVTSSNSNFMTITKFLKKYRVETDYDILIIDECSTVNNKDMKALIEKASYQLLILVGDSYQISSIRFGNWFDIARSFVPERSVTELTKPYRSNDEGLLMLWDRVRHMDDKILEVITRNDYSTTLDESIFAESERDEIILCLNYDGLYGINNINRFLQESNPQRGINWGVQQYKINDPILFNATERFSPVIYNNMKGRILGIRVIDSGMNTERIQFDIELETAINGLEAQGQSFELLSSTSEGNAVIRFDVNKLKSVDEDDDGNESTVVPFQVAYAVSIHKAQGLEYKSVKIVITDEVEELISHNIFYTAITRAREKLKIYWSPEVENKILTTIKPRNVAKDVGLLRRIIG